MSKMAGGGEESNEPLVKETRVEIQPVLPSEKPSTQKPDAKAKAKAKAKTKEEEEEEEREDAYSRLMEHLDGIRSRNREWRKYIARAIKVVVFSCLVSGLVCSVTVEPTNRKRVLEVRIWRWVTMALMITSIMSVVPAFTWAVSWPIMLAFRTHKYAVYYIREMRRSVDFTLWSCLVLFGWYTWFRPHVKPHHNAHDLLADHGDLLRVACKQITRGLIALCIGFFLWSLKTALYLKLKADLHYDQLFDRIRQTVLLLNGIKVLEKPKDPNLRDFLVYDKDVRLQFKDRCTNPGWTNKAKFALERKWVNWSYKFTKNTPEKKGNIWMDVFKMRRETAPIWIIERLSKEYLRIIPYIKDNQKLVNDHAELLKKAEEMFWKITGLDNRKHMDKSDTITEENVVKYDLSEEELACLFSSEQVGDRETRKREKKQYEPIQGDMFLQWAFRVHKNCWGLQSTLKSSKAAFVKLNRMLSTFLIVVVVIIWLLLSNIVSTAQLALLFAPFLAASFMFENSSKDLFQGIIFAFAMHPFDVGDRVIIEDIQMRVKEVHILTSVFYKYDTGAEVIFPNSTLAKTKIVNLDISPDQSDKLDFIINFKTPLENIKDLELRIKKLLDGKLDYAAGTKVVKNTCVPYGSSEKGEDQPELHMSVYFKYLVSYLTADKKAERKSEILTDIMIFCKEMENKQNMQEYKHDFIPYELELSTKKKVILLPGIERLKREILRRVEKRGYQYHKVVMTHPEDTKMTHLEDTKIKMALYVTNYSIISSSSEEEKKDDKESQKLKEVKLDSKNSHEEIREAKEESKYSDEQIKEKLKNDDNLFAELEPFLSEYDYALKVVRGKDTIYDSSNKQSATKVLQASPTSKKEKEVASSSTWRKNDIQEITAKDRSNKS